MNYFRQFDRELEKDGDNKEKFDGIKSKMNKVKKRSNRDIFGNREKDHDWEAIANTHLKVFLRKFRNEKLKTKN